VRPQPILPEARRSSGQFLISQEGNANVDKIEVGSKADLRFIAGTSVEAACNVGSKRNPMRLDAGGQGWSR
jgi:hypothetical protein